MTPFVAVENGDELEDLNGLVAPGETVGILSVYPSLVAPDWDTVHVLSVHQYVWTEGELPDSPDVRLLTAADIPAMLELTSLVYPAYFRAETALLGDYFGVVRDGHLCAMGGIRMAMDGHQELSAICTHPDARGQGLAAQVTAQLVRHVLDQGDLAFLHTESDNVSAQALYEKLGFQKRAELPFTVARRL